MTNPVDEDSAALMQMDLVRVARIERNAHGVWRRLEELYPEFTRQQIMQAVQPALRRMMENL